MAFSIENLSLELSYPEYEGLSYQQILSKLQEQTVPLLGAIAGDDLRDVVTLLCSGIAYRIKMAETNPIAIMLKTAFDNMQLQNFQFNFASPKVTAMLQIGVDHGFILEEERAEFHRLATKQIPVWPDVTIKDIVSAIHPEKLSQGNLVELGEVPSNVQTLVLTVVCDLPENETVTIEQSVSLNGAAWSNYSRLTQKPGVGQAGVYFIDIPILPKYRRRLRWYTSNYHIDGVLVPN